MKTPGTLTVAMVCHLGILHPALADDAALREQAAAGLKKAVHFFCTQVATEGGYLWRYSEDLSRREGERKASVSQVWVQPPGTPSVGLALLTAYEDTGDPAYLKAAREAGEALIRGQLRSGGWDYLIEFDPRQRPRHAYRVDDGNARGRNVTTLDDNTTQSAVTFLMRLDRVLKFKDERVHDAVDHALTCLLRAQYPNGAWPQRYDAFPDPAAFPVRKANYPETWSRTWPGSDYRSYYTLNDNTLADVIDTMLEASRTYGEEKYRRAALRAGDFFLLAQMPDPQPAWAQQYNADMQPAWARRFEPPAITGSESQRVLRTLLKLYRETGERRFLEPLPRTIEYLRRSRLPDGRLARFYELQTNRPLYFTKDYQLTYSDTDLPTHYGFKVSDSLDAIAREYERLKALDPSQLGPPKPPGRPQVSKKLTAQVQEVLAALDEQGRWVEEGRLRDQGDDDPTRRILDCGTFVRNVGILSRYLAATRP